MKTIIYVLVALAIILGAYFLLFEMPKNDDPQMMDEDTSSLGGAQPLGDAGENPATTTPETSEMDGDLPVTVLGNSAGGLAIEAYHFGNGEKELLFVGGIHGGYEWNTVLLAYEMIDMLEANPELVPEGTKVTVIPVLNPDGLFETVGKVGRFSMVDVPTGTDATVPGRFNGNDVDLNRNFDCDWQTTGTWQTVSVDGGSAPFSEPESKAIQQYIETHTPTAVVVYYSSAGGVFASNCHNGVLPETTEITSIYSTASGYPAYEEFDFYEITGDMVNWLAKENIPAISVLLTNHTDTEWTKNRAGILALFDYYKN